MNINKLWNRRFFPDPDFTSEIPLHFQHASLREWEWSPSVLLIALTPLNFTDLVCRCLRIYEPGRFKLGWTRRDHSSSGDRMVYVQDLFLVYVSKHKVLMREWHNWFCVRFYPKSCYRNILFAKKFMQILMQELPWNENKPLRACLKMRSFLVNELFIMSEQNTATRTKFCFFQNRLEAYLNFPFF